MPLDPDLTYLVEKHLWFKAGSGLRTGEQGLSEPRTLTTRTSWARGEGLSSEEGWEGWVGYGNPRGKKLLMPAQGDWGSGRLWRRAVWMVDRDFWGDGRGPERQPSVRNLILETGGQ